MKRTIFIETICSLLIILFLYSGISKLIDLPGFNGDMRNQVFPMWMAEVLTYTIPPLEITISALLMFDSTRKTGLIASLILMMLFTIYTCLILFGFFPRIPCSCGGVIRKLSWTEHSIFNCFFTSISFIGIRLYKRKGKKSIAASILPSQTLQ